MYTTVSLIIERLSSMPFEQFVHERILAPLGLHHTSLSPSDPPKGDLSEPFVDVARNVSEGEGWEKVLYQAVPFILGETGRPMVGAGGIVTSIADTVRLASCDHTFDQPNLQLQAVWLQTLLLNGRNPHTNATVIPDEVIQQVSQGITVISGRAPYPELSPQVYGAGQHGYSYQGHEVRNLLSPSL